MAAGGRAGLDGNVLSDQAARAGPVRMGRRHMGGAAWKGRPMIRFFPAWCTTVLLVCALGLPAKGQPAAVPVGTVQAQRKAIDQTLDFVGRIEAVGRVEIRARVTGFLDAVLFKEGEPDQGGGAALPDRAGPVRRGGQAGRGRPGAHQGRLHPGGHPAAAGARSARPEFRHRGRARPGPRRAGPGEGRGHGRRGGPPDGADQPRLHRRSRRRSQAGSAAPA